MSVERIKLVHGVYIRISGDHGQQVGAHVEYVERFIDTDTGTILSAQMLPPEPLEKGAEALAPLIGELVITQQTENEALRFQLAEAAARESALQLNLDEAGRDITAQQADLERAHTAIKDQGEQLAALEEQVKQLQETLAAKPEFDGDLCALHSGEH